MKKSKHILLLGVSLIFFFGGILLLDIAFQQQPFQDITTKAIENECDYCINEPSCCADVQINHEAPCDWPIRGYCKPNTCAQIEGKGQRCGWYWIWHDQNDTPGLGTNTPNGYGCMIGASEATMHPRCGPQATPTIYVPSPSPSPTPTLIPSPFPTPTSIPQPTEIPVPIPTTPPSKPTSMMLPLPYLTTTIEPAQPTPDIFSQKNQSNQGQFPSFSLPSLSLPKINLPCTNAKLSIASTNLIVQKPLGLFKNIFSTIKQMDKNMENMINEGFGFVATYIIK